jgi:dimethylargininase
LETSIKGKDVACMMITPNGTYAIVRDVPNTYDKCITTQLLRERINVESAKEQHGVYCKILEKLGLSLIRIKADDKLPDCCFTEDTAIVFEDKAIISCMGAKSRIGEAIEVKKTLIKYKRINKIKPPAAIEGGDVLKINKKVYIGLSGRTNQFGIQQVESLISDSGYEVIPVKIEGILHLKSACTYIGNDYVVLFPGHFDDKIFSEYKKIIVPKREAYSANCLSINGKVLVPKGYPLTKKLIENEGFETIEAEISEFRKGGGGLTCLSIIF